MVLARYAAPVSDFVDEYLHHVFIFYVCTCFFVGWGTV
jgi:hypothetical protein